MIEQTVQELTPIVGTRPACRALGAAPATIYRRRRPPAPRPPRPRPTPARALTDSEREAVLALLHCQRFVDCSPAQVWATLLDEGRYLASERTMYRLLAARHGSVRERRDQLTHPAYAKPELLAERPNELWSWDISKLKGPARWTCFYLYVILDVFSRYAVLFGAAPELVLRFLDREVNRVSAAARTKDDPLKAVPLHRDEGGSAEGGSGN